MKNNNNAILCEYKGRKRAESYLKIKKKSNDDLKQRYFFFDLIEQCFGCRKDKTSVNKFIIYNNELTGFSEVKSSLYGFKILTSKMNYTLFTEDKCIYYQWMRILNFAFNKVDILTPNFVSTYNFFLPLHTQSEDNKRKELIARLNKDIAYIISNTSY